ncbi:MAG: type II 3-dehydroquinate dehydratase [Actinobacteria bacterium]|nr:type II 3-dehydroquinate dehydratase [Actinomycetota bacterium]
MSPNLNLLGTRETDIYGSMSLDEINKKLTSLTSGENIEIDIFQSNHEGEIVEKIQSSVNEVDVIIINPAAFTHYSIAIRDAVAAIKNPVIEVHLSNIYKREEFRQKSVIAPVAYGQISGFGPESYFLALSAAIKMIKG